MPVVMRIGKSPFMQSGPGATEEQRLAFEGYVKFVKEGKLPDTQVALYNERGQYLKSIMASEVGIK